MKKFKNTSSAQLWVTHSPQAKLLHDGAARFGGHHVDDPLDLAVPEPEGGGREAVEDGGIHPGVVLGALFLGQQLYSRITVAELGIRAKMMTIKIAYFQRPGLLK